MKRAEFWAIVTNAAAVGVNLGAILSSLVVGQGARAVFHLAITTLCGVVLKGYYDRALPNTE